MSNEKSILFPTDFSQTGDEAFELAVSLAKERQAKLIIVHVEEPPPAYGGGEMYYGALDPDTKQLSNMLKKIVPDDANVKFEHRLISGSPAGALVRLAKDDDIDMIVMGTHGRSGLARVLMGSIAEEVVRRAPCPVLTYRHQNRLKADSR